MRDMRVNLIACYTDGRIIGPGKSIPMSLLSHQARVQALVDNYPVIIGRKTHEDNILSYIDNYRIVLSQNELSETSKVRVAKTLKEAINISSRLHLGGEVFILGGAKVFEQALKEDLVQRAFLTRIKHAFEGNVKLPPFSDEKWEGMSLEQFTSSIGNPYPYWFFTLYMKTKSR
jgi:dihydrofolate reductase